MGIVEVMVILASIFVLRTGSTCTILIKDVTGGRLTTCFFH
jgi:hypothetical protein